MVSKAVDASSRYVSNQNETTVMIDKVPSSVQSNFSFWKKKKETERNKKSVKKKVNEIRNLYNIIQNEEMHRQWLTTD